jgi:tetratricopeptide (TPR) repeat protein
VTFQYKTWLRIYRILLSFFVLSVGWGASMPGDAAAAMPQEAVAAGEQESISLAFQPTYTASFDYFWNRYLVAARSGDAQEAERILGEIRRLRVERNAFELHDVALAFTFLGARHLERGELDAAESNFTVAKELDPDLPTAYAGLAEVARESGGLGLVGSASYTLRGFLASLRSERNSQFAKADLYRFGVSVLALVFGIFAILMLYRYGGLLKHDISERFDRFGGIAVTAIVLLLPLMLTFGFGWLLPFWLAITFGYQTLRERVITVLALVLILGVAPLVEFHSQWSKTELNPLYRASQASLDGSFEPTDVLVIQNALDSYPEDRGLHFLVATLYKLLGEYELSASLYRTILQKWPNDLAARINLGNIYFAQRDWEGAVIEYDRAIDDDPNSAAAYYNKSLAHAESFEFRDREAARGTAEMLDGRLVASHERKTGEFRAAIDKRLSPREVRFKFYGLEGGMHGAPVSPSWIDAWLNGLGSPLLYGALIMGALIVLLHYMFNRENTHHCWKCGMAFCGRCQIGTGRRGLCTQCYHLFVVKDGVSAAAKNDKLLQVEQSARKQGAIFRILSIVAPGAGHIAEGVTLLGFVLLLVWVKGVLVLVTGGRFYGLPDDVMGLSSSVSSYLAVGSMLVVLVLANLLAQPRARG